MMKCDCAVVPTRAPEGADDAAYYKRVAITGAFQEKELLDRLVKLFEERPIWTRAALLSRIEDPSLHVTWYIYFLRR